MATITKYSAVGAINHVEDISAAVEAKIDEARATATLDFTVVAVDGDVITIGANSFNFTASPTGDEVQAGGAPEDQIAAFLAQAEAFGDDLIYTQSGNLVTVTALDIGAEFALAFSYDDTDTVVADAAATDAEALVPGDAWQPYGSLSVKAGFGSNGQARSFVFTQAMVVYDE